MQTAQHAAATAGSLVLDRYALIEELGAGGFASVWLARDERLERLVAVKRIAVSGLGGSESAARAEKEALAAARLSHPTVVALYEAGRDDSAVYLVTELVRGSTLGALLKEGALSDRDVALIGLALCDALAHAHSRGVVHRDVKPGNVLVPESPAEGAVAKLTDFGIARISGDDALTATGDVVGTLAYMAPEQAEGRGATAASDVYSLGLVLYEAFSGANPIRGANAAATARNVGMRLPALRRLRRGLPRGLCAAVDAAVLPEAALRGGLDALRLALAEALPLLTDDPGILQPTRWSAKPGPDPGKSTQPRRPEPVRDETEDLGRALPRPPVAIPARLLAATTAAATTAAVLAWTAVPAPADPATIAAAAAVTVALLPRLGWLLVTLAAVAWLVAEGSGDWLYLAAGAAPLALLLPLRPAWLSSPVVAIGLNTVSVAAAWPAIAGQARGVVTRAVLGAAGAWWLLMAARPQPDGDPLLPTAAVWAAAAAVLPFLVRGRNAGADVLAATLWAAGLAAGTAGTTGTAPVGAAALAALTAVLAGALKRT